MMRTIEVLLVIIIIAGAYVAVSYLTVLPDPREVAPVNLRRLSLATLQMLDSDYDLGSAVFDTNPEVWGKLQVALSASLPPNVVYNLTVYEVNGEDELYTYNNSIANTEDLGPNPDVSVYMVASSNVTYNVVAEKIGEDNGGTLYILNCSDANGWWITGYTAQSLAQDLYNLLSPYFVKTVMVQNTTQMANILSGVPLEGEVVQNAVVINTFGEAVPIPDAYCHDYVYTRDNYAGYSHFLGQKVNQYNWTWASIVGYPFYYVSNTATFSGNQNNWGIYGMIKTEGGGSIAFLRGLDNQAYGTSGTAVTDSVTRQATLSQIAIEACNYYGIYPSSSQTSTRALTNSILATYHLSIGLNLFDPVLGYNPGTLYTHGTTTISGSLLAIGLARTPDIRLTALGLLSYYHPRLFPSKYTASGTSRMVVLQLGLMGGS
jgi:hypothetical protein